MHIRIADFVFHGGDLPSPTGFTVSSLTGWTGGPGVKRGTIARQGGPGSFSIKGYATDRVVVFRGRYHGSSIADVQYMNDALSGLESLEQRATVAWPESRWVNAHVDKVRFDPQGALPWADYQVELWVPDSVKFGDLHTVGPVAANVPATLHHYGNTPAYPRFVVSGPQPSGYSIFATGKPSFQVNSPLASGSTDVVDFATGRVYRNGSLLVGGVSFPRTWSVPGGVTQPWSFGGTGSGTCTGEIPDTYK
ncbi:hypothetical protein [Agrococcus sp. DT81.2]|uniref:hypothetical protein n=1 Tax=Agrococcus sp. DT81.2 TaxID=3393414 RepID=UPI003CE59BB0